MKRHRIHQCIVRIGFVALVAMMVAACAAQPAKPLKKVTFVTGAPALDAANANFTVAQELGYFSQEGLDVTIQPSQGGGGGATQLLATGGVEFISVVSDPMLTSLASGVDLGLVSVYAITHGGLFEYLIVRPDSPIKDYKDLKGKKIGVATLTPSSLGFPQAVLRGVGLDPDKDVEFIAVGRGQQSALALQNGQIDALNDTKQALLQLEPLGFNFRPLPAAKLSQDLMGLVVLVRRDYLQSNRDAVLGFLRGVLKGTVFTMTNPEAAVQLHWRYAPESKSKSAANDQEAMKEAQFALKIRLDGFEVSGRSDPRWGLMTDTTIKTQVDFLGFAGKIKEPEKYFTNDLIPDVNKVDLEPIRQQARNWKP